MAGRLNHDCLYTILDALCETPPLTRFCTAMSTVGLPLPRYSAALPICARVSRAWSAAAHPLMIRFIRLATLCNAERVASLTTNPAVGRVVQGLHFTAWPDRSIEHVDLAWQSCVLKIVANCPNLRVLVLGGWTVGGGFLAELATRCSFARLTAFDLRVRDPLKAEKFRVLLNAMPNLQALAFGPGIVGDALPPMCRLKSLVTAHCSFAAYTWLLGGSAETLTLLHSDGMFDAALDDLLKALRVCGSSIRHLELHAASHVARVLPLCPKVTHLRFPILERHLDDALLAIQYPLIELHLIDNSVGCRSGITTLSAQGLRSLIDAIDRRGAFASLKRLDLDFKPGFWYAHVPAELAELREVCCQRQIAFDCPECMYQRAREATLSGQLKMKSSVSCMRAANLSQVTQAGTSYCLVPVQNV